MWITVKYRKNFNFNHTKKSDANNCVQYGGALPCPSPHIFQRKILDPLMKLLFFSKNLLIFFLLMSMRDCYMISNLNLVCLALIDKY